MIKNYLNAFLASAFCASLLLASFSSLAYAQGGTKTPQYVDTGEKVFDFGSEPIRYIENDRVKVGFDLSIGGAVVYLEDKANKSGNMINSFDWGRQIQLSYYSGPRPFIGPNGEQPSPSWAGLGWNPIQSGDCGGYGSRVLEFEASNDKAFVKTRPMLWPHSGVPAECVFECRYQLTDNGFQLDATIINNRSDKKDYGGNSQETPALYTNAPWYKLVSYIGDKPYENEPVTVVVDKGDGKGWPWVYYYTPESWSALVNDDNFGVGVYQPFSTRTTAGFHGGDAAKGRPLGTKDGPTGYIAPLETTILDWNIKRTYRATFIVGSLDEIRKTVYELAKENYQATPEWVFESDRRNWVYANATDEGFPIKGALKINLNPKINSVALSPQTFWKAENAKKLEIELALKDDLVSKDGAKIDGAKIDDELTIKLVPVAPSDLVDYLGWSEGDKDAAKDRAEKAKKYPDRPALAVKARVKFDETSRVVSVDLSQVEGYEGGFKQLEIVFPKRAGKAIVSRVGFVK